MCLSIFRPLPPGAESFPPIECTYEILSSLKARMKQQGIAHTPKSLNLLAQVNDQCQVRVLSVLILPQAMNMVGAHEEVPRLMDGLTDRQVKFFYSKGFAAQAIVAVLMVSGCDLKALIPNR